MVSRSLRIAVDRLQDAAAEPDLWRDVLPLVSDALGGVGAACFGCNDLTRGVEWAYFHGPASEQKYVEHYAAVDPYTPVRRTSRDGGWLSIADCVPQEVLQRNEWYLDYVRPSGIREVLGAQVHRAESRSIYFGIQYDTPQNVPPRDARAQQLLQRIQAAAGVWHQHRMLRLHASLGEWTADHHPDALFIVYDGGRVVDMNAAAERLLSRRDVLLIESGRLVPVNEPDAAALAALMSAPETNTDAEPRLLLGAAQDAQGHVVTASPLPNAGPNIGRVVVRVTSLHAEPPLTADLQRVFGLTPAEGQLAQALLKGRTIAEMTAEFGVSMPTLRVQVRSVFRKCGVKRQVDLMRVLLRAT